MARRSVLRFGWTMATLAFLSACGGDYNITEVRMIEPVDGTYYLALQQGYADVAQWKQNEMNWSDSEILLGKARQAAAGEIPLLEAPATPELERDLARLQAALRAIDQFAHPIDSALARVAYDCMAQSAINEPHPEKNGGHNCPTTFDEAVQTLEELAAMPDGPTEITFADDAVELNEAAHKTLADLAETIARANPSLVLISGFSDPSAARTEAVIITQKRALAVQQALLDAGVGESQIKQMIYDDQGAISNTNTAVSENPSEDMERVAVPLKQITVTLVK